MSVNTLVKEGLLTNIGVPVKIARVNTGKDVDYNPGLARDPEGNIWIAIRSCITNLEKWRGMQHPMKYQNFLYVGLLDETALEINSLKEIIPEADYDEYFHWGPEDMRLFWRDDSLHGIGVAIPVEDGQYKIRQVEILIDHAAGTYKLIKDYGRPFGHVEKNWMPSEHPNPYFDFIYSTTQIVRDGEVIGEPNDLFLHQGTPLIEYEDGYISIAHAVIAVLGERTYGQIALKWDATGNCIAHSQFFHFNVGWREGLKETIEFTCGLLWSTHKKDEELLVGLGIKDELIGLCRLPVSKFRWEPYADTMWYSWAWDSPPNRTEIH